MSKYTAMLRTALAEQAQSRRGAALRGGIPIMEQDAKQESAPQRFKRLGHGLGVPMNEWLRFYAAGLDAIEQDAELTDQKLLAFMQDYADRVRVRYKPGHDKVITFPEVRERHDYKHYYPAALAALQAVFTEHRQRLVSSGYPATQARVSIGD